MDSGSRGWLHAGPPLRSPGTPGRRAAAPLRAAPSRLSMGSEEASRARGSASPLPPRAAAPNCGAERPCPALPLGRDRPPGGVRGAPSGWRPRGGGSWGAGGRCGPLSSPIPLIGAPLHARLQSPARGPRPAPTLTPRGLTGAAARRGAAAPELRGGEARPRVVQDPSPPSRAAPAAGSGSGTGAATPLFPLPIPFSARPDFPHHLRGRPECCTLSPAGLRQIAQAGPCLAELLSQLSTPGPRGGGAKRRWVRWRRGVG